ncbi:MAG: molybdopterin-dependent oxidoreductase [Methylococcaceae bacterium]
MTTILTTCPYCGVGCGIQAQVNQQQRTLSISGDKSHPANFGRLCSKGSALGETVDLQGRLLEPRIAGRNTSWDEALDLVARKFSQIIEQYGKNAVAIYGSGQLLTEDYYVANKFIKGFIGTANMDTNSRLCMSSSVAGHKRAFGADIVPCCYEDLELASMMVLIGSNAAWCHPVSFQRIRAAKQANPDLKIVVIDPRQTSSCDIADLHLPLASGTDGFLFNGLLCYLQDKGLLNQAYIDKHTEGFEQALATAKANSPSIEQVAKHCGLSASDVQCFYEWFAENEKVLSLYSQGINQSSSGTDKVNAIINCHLATARIGKAGMGPFSLTGQPNAMGGREVGGLAHQLAAHTDFSNPDDIDRVARFWGSDSIAQTGGLPAVALFDAILDGTIKAVWIMGTNPVVSLPNADKVKRALQACEFVVVSDCIAQTDTTALAHVLLPAQGWSEKNGTVTNSERRISRQRALFAPAGQAKADWWIISQVAKRMGFEQAFAYQHPAEIFREHAALSGFENNGSRDFDLSALSDISIEQYDAFTPTQWPINATYPNGRARFFDDNHFFTASGKAQFLAITPRLPVNAPSETYPLILNTGRLRDQWHTMTRTALSARLNNHKPEPFVEIHPLDAQSYGLSDNSLALIENQWGKMLARVQISQGQRQGNVFVPMHWTAQYASQGRMGALVNAEIDPISKQPESKHTPVKISAYAPVWQGFILTRDDNLAIDTIDYWVKSKNEHCYRYELAGNNSFESIRDFFANTDNSQDYRDDSHGQYRAAQFINNKLQSVLFISTQDNLPSRSWLLSLFAQDEINITERKFLLTGKAPVGVVDVGAIVCACFNVGMKTIQTAIKEQGLKNYQEVGVCLKAGTNCGSCIPEIKALLG